MSAQALRAEFRTLITTHIDTQATVLIDRTGDTLDQMRLTQGCILGMRLAVELMEEAYKRIGS